METRGGSRTAAISKMEHFVRSTTLKKETQHRCFPVIIEKLLRILISKNIWERLLLFI